MTIAIGVVCSDGVVLGTDLQYTQGFNKFPGRKLWNLCPEKHLHILLVGAGSPASIEHVIRIAEVELRQIQPGNAPTVEQIRGSIEKGLCSLYATHIDPAPESERNDLEAYLLLAVPEITGTRLFANSRTHFVEEEWFRCDGSGVGVGYYGLHFLLSDHPSVEVAAQVVSFIIALAKRYANYVGGGSNVHMVYNDGRWDSFIAPEHTKIENAFERICGPLQGVIGCCDPLATSEHELDDSLARLKAAMLEIRNLKSDRDQRRTARAKRLADSLNPQSTKADPSPPPPLPE